MASQFPETETEMNFQIFSLESRQLNSHFVMSESLIKYIIESIVY